MIRVLRIDFCVELNALCFLQVRAVPDENTEGEGGILLSHCIIHDAEQAIDPPSCVLSEEETENMVHPLSPEYCGDSVMVSE